MSSNVNPISFHTPRTTDRETISRLQKAFADSALTGDELSVSWIAGGEPTKAAWAELDLTAEDSSGDPELDMLLTEFAEFASSIRVSLTQGGGSLVKITRKAAEASMAVQLYPGNARFDRAVFLKFSASLQNHLGLYEPALSLGATLSDDARQHYSARQADLARLETLAEKLISSNQQYRHAVDAEYFEKQNLLEARIEREREELAESAAQGMESLNAERASLAKVRQEVDDRGARHARREIRADLKKEIAARNETFELTPGTRSMRKHVYVFTVALLLLFGGFFAAFLVLGIVQLLDGTSLTNQQLVALGVKQLATTLLFATTAIFFVRWNNGWLAQHSEEEFRLKRLDLDIDRASWVVELAMEWQEQTQSPIPELLIDRLTAELFRTSDRPPDPARHPTDDVFEALLRGTKEAEIALPTGSKITVAGGAVRKLVNR